MLLTAQHYTHVRFDEKQEIKGITKRLWSEPYKHFSYRFGRYLQPPKGDWLSLVEKTIEKSKICLIFPPLTKSSGTAKEVIELLDKGYAYKAVFIMPANRNSWPGFRKFGYKNLNGEKILDWEIWSGLIQLTKNYISLPDYSNKGGFVLQINGKYTLTRGCAGADWWHSRCIKAIFLTGQLTPSPMKEAMLATFNLIFTIPLYVMMMLFLISVVYVFFENIFNIKTVDLYVGISLILIFIIMTLFKYYRYADKFMLNKPSKFIIASVPLIALLIISSQRNFFAGISSNLEFLNIHVPSSATASMIKNDKEEKVLTLLGAWYFFTFMATYIVLKLRKSITFEAGSNDRSCEKVY